jgi:uncharacterized integral membrane protein
MTSPIGERHMFPVQMNERAVAGRAMMGILARKDYAMAPKLTPQQRWTAASVVAFLVLLWFALANSASVTIHFWFASERAPLIIVIVVSALLGMLGLELARRSRK